MMTEIPCKHPEALVLTQRRENVTVVTLNAAERMNPISLRMRHALFEVFRYLFDVDTETRAIVLCGDGENFSNGEDFSVATEPSQLMVQRDRAAIGTRVFREIISGNKPVVVAVEGICFGSGLGLACAADMVVASETSRYCCDFVKRGELPDLGLLWTLPKKVGPGLARQLMLDGRTFTAEQALEWGLLSRKVAPGQALAAAIEQARELTTFPPAAVALLKAALVNGMNSIDDAWREEMDLNPLVRAMEDHREAVNAFMEKRAPVFTGD